MLFIVKLYSSCLTILEIICICVYVICIEKCHIWPIGHSVKHFRLQSKRDIHVSIFTSVKLLKFSGE